MNLYLGPAHLAGHTRMDSGSAHGNNRHPYLYTLEVAISPNKVSIQAKRILKTNTRSL